MEPFIGQIILFGAPFAPRGWAFCDGQLLPVAQHSALFSIIGTTYGGDGRTTFALPDLRGRAPIHAGHGPGLTPRTLGSKGGIETNALIVGKQDGGGNPQKGSEEDIAATLDNMQPFLTMNYIIALEGIFPSRS